MSANLGTDMHDLISWTEGCDMQRFVEKYSKRHLPCLVRVSEGYAGRDEAQHLFAQHEVYMVQDVFKQSRLIATDHSDKYISIPLDYKLRFYVIDRNNISQPKPLSELAERLQSQRDLDFMIENDAPVLFNVGAEVQDKKVLGRLRFDMMYDQKYLVAYPIVGQQLHPRLVAIPTFVPLTLEVAAGFKYGSQTEFERFNSDLWRIIRRFDRFPLTICNDILLSDEPPESEYEYVNPVKMVLAGNESDSQSPTDSDLGRSSLAACSFGLNQRPNAYYIPPRQPATVIRKQFSNGNIIKKNKAILLPPMPKPGNESLSSPSLLTKTKSGKQPGPPVPPRKVLMMHDSNSSDGCDRVCSTVSNDSPRRADQHGYLPVFDDDNNNDVTLAGGFMRRANSADELSTSRADLSFPRQTRNIGLRPGLAGRSATQQRSRNIDADERVFDDIGLVPANIASLSVEEIGECLDLLHLGDFVKAFHEQDVDGQLLCCLNESILVTDFNFKVFEATKLMKFAVDGWRPLRRYVPPTN